MPRVGVGVLVLRDGLLLLGQRRGAHGQGTWAPPGGHLEFGESVEACAAREVREETGLELTRTAPGPCINTIFRAEQQHYLTVFIVATCAPGMPQRCEPEKCDGWHWFAWDALPHPLFAPLEQLGASGFVPVAPAVATPSP